MLVGCDRGFVNQAVMTFHAGHEQLVEVRQGPPESSLVRMELCWLAVAEGVPLASLRRVVAQASRDWFTWEPSLRRSSSGSSSSLSLPGMSTRYRRLTYGGSTASPNATSNRSRG